MTRIQISVVHVVNGEISSRLARILESKFDGVDIELASIMKDKCLDR